MRSETKMISISYLQKVSLRRLRERRSDSLIVSVVDSESCPDFSLFLLQNFFLLPLHSTLEFSRKHLDSKATPGQGERRSNKICNLSIHSYDVRLRSRAPHVLQSFPLSLSIFSSLSLYRIPPSPLTSSVVLSSTCSKLGHSDGLSAFQFL